MFGVVPVRLFLMVLNLLERLVRQFLMVLPCYDIYFDFSVLLSAHCVRFAHTL